MYESELNVLIERKNLAKPAWLRYKIAKATETSSEKKYSPRDDLNFMFLYIGEGGFLFQEILDQCFQSWREERSRNLILESNPLLIFSI